MPPGFCNVMVSEDRFVGTRQKTCAKGVHLKTGPWAAEIEASGEKIFPENLVWRMRELASGRVNEV